MTAEEIRKAIASLEWKLNYAQFLEVLALRDDSYAEAKWQAWKDLGTAVANMGPLLDKLVEHYFAQPKVAQ